MRYTLYIVLTLSVLVVFSGCRKPRKFVRTKQQQQRVADAILTAEPAPKWKSGANFMEKVELLGVDITPETHHRVEGNHSLLLEGIRFITPGR